jgi:carbonic anhydrase
MKLNRFIAGSVFLASALFASSHGTHWGYTGHEGPSNWGDLDPKYTMCKVGASQSPINIVNGVTIDTADLQPIGFEYKTGSANVINNGHSVQVNVKDGSSINIDGIKFDLKQFHFHTPSENQIEGKNFPLEAHFVHASADGKLAVIAVLFENGAENPTLKKIWSKMPHKVGESAALELSADLVSSLLPKKKDYYRFSGSLTTPPCSEGVRWFVMKDYLKISKEQTEEFLHLLHHPNNRPIQAINARKVME